MLITGASKGIGAAAADAFAEKGCDLRLAARSGDQLKALAVRPRSAHQLDASVHVTDLPEDIARLASRDTDSGSFNVGMGDKLDESKAEKLTASTSGKYEPLCIRRHRKCRIDQF